MVWVRLIVPGRTSRSCHRRGGSSRGDSRVRHLVQGRLRNRDAAEATPRATQHGSSKNIPQEWINSALAPRPRGFRPAVLEPCCVALGVLGGIPVLNRTLNRWRTSRINPDWTLRVCDSFDWVRPHYQSHQPIAELQGWFVERGLATSSSSPRPGPAASTIGPITTTSSCGSGVNVAGTKRP